MSNKILKMPYFCSVKMVPPEVILFLTLEVILFLALERLKRGTETNSPAYIYIYIHTYADESMGGTHLVQVSGLIMGPAPP